MAGLLASVLVTWVTFVTLDLPALVIAAGAFFFLLRSKAGLISTSTGSAVVGILYRLFPHP